MQGYLLFVRALVAAFLSLLLVAACAPRLEGQAEIYYVGFGFEIFLPITPENIVEHSSYGQVDVADPRFQEVVALLDAAEPGSFYEGTTRIRIRDSNGTTVYIDSGGGIRRASHERALGDAALKRVAELLESMISATSARPASDLPAWAEEVAHIYVAETRGWPRADYSLARKPSDSGAIPERLIVAVAKVSYRDRVTPTFSAYRRVMAAHSNAFELHFDTHTKKLLRARWHQ